MRISDVARESGVPVGTIKFYMREGLLSAGRKTSRTTAVYDESHVERLRLVRALTEVGGLGIAQVQRIVSVLDAPESDWLELLGAAQDAVVEDASSAEDSEADGRPATGEDLTARARQWAVRRGWLTSRGDDELLAQFARAWDACECAGIEVDEPMMDAYADAAEEVARVDHASVPADSGAAVHRVVVGIVMLEPVLSALRLLAQREIAVAEKRTGVPDDSPGAAEDGAGTR